MNKNDTPEVREPGQPALTHTPALRASSAPSPTGGIKGGFVGGKKVFPPQLKTATPEAININPTAPGVGQSLAIELVKSDLQIAASTPPPFDSGTALAPCAINCLIHVSNPYTASQAEKTAPDVPDLKIFSRRLHPDNPATVDPTYDGVDKRLARYTPARHRSLQMATYLDGLDTRSAVAGSFKIRKISDDLRGCGSWLEFQDFAPAGLDESRLVSAYFCSRFRLCPLCAIRRSAKWIRHLLPRMQTVIADYRRHTPTATLQLVTWTVRDGRSLRRRLEHLRASWQTLQQRRRLYLSWCNTRRGKPRAFTELAHADGILFSFEVKRGKGSGSWHPHIHAVVIAPHLLDQTAMRAEWESITRDSFMVDVRPFYSQSLFEHSDQYSRDDIEEALGNDLAEVAKYALKFQDLSIRDNWRAEHVLYGKRLRGSIGVFRGVDPDPSLLDDPLDMADLPFVLRIAQWEGDSYRTRTNNNPDVLQRSWDRAYRIINQSRRRVAEYEKQNAGRPQL